MVMDLFVQLQEFVLVDLIGSELLFGVGLVFVIWLLLSIARTPQKVTLLIIAPALMTLAFYAWIPSWVWAMTAVLIGMALAAVIFKLYYSVA